MDFSFTQEQELLRKTARDLFGKHAPRSLVREMETDAQGYSPDLWKQMAGLGWLGVPFDPAYGGAGGSFLDLAVLMEEAGRALAPAPIFSTVVLGGMPVARFGAEAQKRMILPQVGEGQAIMTFAILEHERSWTPRGIQLEAAKAGNGYKLNGVKFFVENAHVARYMLVAARTGRAEQDVTVFIVDGDAPGITRDALKPFSLDKYFEVTLKDVAVPADRVLGQVNGGWPIVRKAMDWAIGAQCVQSVGGAQAVLEISVDYAKMRVQFGQPIGKFQAVQHHAADMYIDVETMRLIAYELAWKLSADRPCAEDVAMAKVWVANTYNRMTRTGIQIHGGIGLAKETDPQLYFRRAKTWEALYGGLDMYRAQVGAALAT